MKREDLLPARMTALWLVYVAVWFSMINSDYSLGLDLLHLLGAGGLVAVLVNLWNVKRSMKGRTLMDERKQRLATRAMAWGFVTMSLGLLVAVKTANEPFDAMQDVLELGFWTWLLVLSVSILWQRWR